MKERLRIGVLDMFFKRQEGFRFSFDEPVIAKVKMIVKNNIVTKNGVDTFEAGILDISPRGLKIYSETDFSEGVNDHVHLEIRFVLDASEIVGIGEIVWQKMFGKGWQYGIIFEGQAAIENLIISELKNRRRKEVKQLKSK